MIYQRFAELILILYKQIDIYEVENNRLFLYRDYLHSISTISEPHRLTPAPRKN